MRRGSERYRYPIAVWKSRLVKVVERDLHSDEGVRWSKNERVERDDGRVRIVLKCSDNLHFIPPKSHMSCHVS